MPQNCSEVNCGKLADSQCLCCVKNFCKAHYDSHFERRKSELAHSQNKLNNFLEEIRGDVSNRIRNEFDNSAATWLADATNCLQNFIDEKRSELEKILVEKYKSLDVQVKELQGKMEKTGENSKEIFSEVEKLEKSFLEKSQNLIEIHLKELRLEKNEISFLDPIRAQKNPFSSAVESIHFTRYPMSPKPIASNNRFLLAFNRNSLYFFDERLEPKKQIQCGSEQIEHILFSKKQDAFFLLGPNKIFQLEQSEDRIREIFHDETNSFLSFAASTSSLCIVTGQDNSSLLRFDFDKDFSKPEIVRLNFIEQNQNIEQISYGTNRFALIVRNSQRNSKSMEILNSSFQRGPPPYEFQANYFLHTEFYLCPWKIDEWFVFDWKNSTIFHLSDQNVPLHTHTSQPTIYRSCLFKNFMALSQKGQIELRKLD